MLKFHDVNEAFIRLQAIFAVKPDLICFNGAVGFEIDADPEQTWVLVGDGEKVRFSKAASNVFFDLKLSMSSQVFLALVNQELNPQRAYLEKKLKLEGNYTLAFSLFKVFLQFEDHDSLVAN